MKTGQLIICFSLLFSSFLNSQRGNENLTVQTLDQTNGLPVDYVKRFLFDHDGFLWITSAEALYKYDGNHYQAYYYNPNNPLALKKGSFDNIFKDSQNRLWLTGYEGGLCYIDKSRSASKTFVHAKADSSSIASNHTASIFEDSNQNIWVASRNYVLHKFNEEAQNFTRYKVDIPSSLLNYENEFSSFGEIHEDVNDSNILWIGSRFGLVRFNINKQSTKLFALDREHIKWGYSEIPIYQTGTKIFYGGTLGQGIFVFDTKTLEYEKQILLNGNPSSAYDNSVRKFKTLSKDEVLIISMGAQLHTLNLTTQEIAGFKDEQGITSFGALTDFTIQNENIWINNGNKIHVISKKQFPFEAIHFKNYFEDINKQNAIISFLEHPSKNIIYMGSLGGDGMWAFDLDKDKMQLHRLGSGPEPDQFDYDFNDLIYDENGLMWIAGGYNIEIFNEAKSKVTPLEISPSLGSLIKDPITYRLAIDKDYLWIGLFENGIVRMDLETKTLVPFSEDNYFLLKNQRVSAIEVDERGVVWISTDTGLYSYQENDKEAKSYPFEKIDNSQLKINDLELEGDILYLGTFGQGVWQLNLVSQKLVKYENKLNPESNLIYKVERGKDQLLWLSSQYGISYLNLSSAKFKDFNKGNSVQSTWIEYELLASESGDVYYGNSWRFWKFSKKTIDEYSNLPEVYIADLEYGGKKTPTSLNDNQSINLKSDERDISIKLGALNFNKNSANVFKYRMNGYEESWSESNESNLIKYSNLKHGEYTFQYAVKDQYSDKDPKIKIISIEVAPKLHETWWFRLLTLIGIIALSTYLFLKYDKLRQHKKRIKSANQYFLNQELFSSTKSELIKEIGSSLVANLELDKCSIILANGNLNQLSKYSFSSDAEVQLDQLDLDLNELEKVYHELENTNRSSLSPLKVKTLIDKGTQSYMYARIEEADQFGGVIICEQRKSNYFNAEYYGLLDKLSMKLGAHIDKINSIKALQKKDEALMELKVERAQSELKALRAQMNPHFLFNTLNSINWYIIKNKPLEASKYLTKFSHLMRQILDNSKTNLITLSRELETLKLYIDLEAIRFEGQFEYEINVDPKLELDLLQVPPLIFQPFVENAIWHGLLHKEGSGRIMIAVNQIEGFLSCMVEDDGVGRAASAKITSARGRKRSSSGLNITSNRIEALSGIANNLKIIDLKDKDGNATGTRVEFLLPLNK